MNKPIKILFIQLPPPYLNESSNRENIPLSAGYLISYFKNYSAKKNNYELKIADSFIIDYAGDSALLNYIINYKPDVVAFTLYCWNIQRSIYIAEKIKNIFISAKLICGGPEVTSDNTFLFSDTNNIFDYYFIGEGEESFKIFLETNFCSREKIIFQNYNSNKIVSPYLAGILNPDKDFIKFETVRGCKNRCKYCFYNKLYKNQIYIDDSQIKKLFDYSEKNKFKEIYIIDPSFNIRKNFKLFLKKIILWNKKKIKIHTELNAEIIDSETADLLKQAGIYRVETGLQTINKISLKNSNINKNPKNFVRGIEYLKQSGIECIIDLIIGLPFDTVNTILKNYDFMKKYNLDDDMQIFNLSILPGTAFRTETNIHKFKYMFDPPYYLQSSKYISEKEMRNLVNYAEEFFNIDFDPFEIPEFKENEKISNPINLSLTLNFTNEKINELFNQIKKLNFIIPISNTFRLKIINFKKTYSKELMLIIKRLSENNPHTIFIFLIESSYSINEDIELANLILKNFVFNNSHYINNFYYYKSGKNVKSNIKLCFIKPYQMKIEDDNIYILKKIDKTNFKYFLNDDEIDMNLDYYFDLQKLSSKEKNLIKNKILNCGFDNSMYRLNE